MRVAFHLSHLVSWCVVCLPELASSASFGLTETLRVAGKNWPIAEDKPAINKTARFDLLKLMAFGCIRFGVPRERLLVVLSCFEEISSCVSKRFSIFSRIPCKAKQELLYISVAVKCYFMHMIDTSFSHRNISFAAFHLLQALVLKLAQRGT